MKSLCRQGFRKSALIRADHRLRFSQGDVPGRSLRLQRLSRQENSNCSPTPQIHEHSSRSEWIVEQQCVIGREFIRVGPEFTRVINTANTSYFRSAEGSRASSRCWSGAR